jgi:hypothetical protein
VAHIDGKGMGGTPDGSRNSRTNLILLCVNHHQYDKGPSNPQGSLERNDLQILPVTPEGAEGPLEFYATGEDAQFYMVCREVRPREYEID